MIRFFESGQNGKSRIFTVSENGGKAGEGALELDGNKIYIRFAARDEQTKDFLLRSLLNICRNQPDKICVSETKITQFGFTKQADGTYTVRTEEIELGGVCKP